MTVDTDYVKTCGPARARLVPLEGLRRWNKLPLATRASWTCVPSVPFTDVCSLTSPGKELFISPHHTFMLSYLIQSPPPHTHTAPKFTDMLVCVMCLSGDRGSESADCDLISVWTSSGYSLFEGNKSRGFGGRSQREERTLAPSVGSEGSR